MKKIYKAILALAASLVLVPVMKAQDPNPEKYLFDEDKGIGYNKYLVSNTPNSNGEYTLRIENFITGHVKATAIPTDFVIVLDASGSMEYDYRPEGLVAPMNDAAANWNKFKDYMVPVVGTEDKFSHLSIYYTWAAGAVGSAGSGGTPSTTNRKGTRSNYSHFVDENANNTCTLYYHFQDGTGNDGYYKIFRRMFDASDGSLVFGPADPSTAATWYKYAGSDPSSARTTLAARPATVWYNLAIRLKDGTYKYLNNNGLSDTPYNATENNTIMFINDGNLARLQRRREAMIDGVEGFVELVAEENAKDQWADRIPAKHQVAIVRFSGDYPSGGATITPPTSYSTATHVMYDFTEITGESEADAFIENFEDKYIVAGSTYTDYGMYLAKELLSDLQTREGGIYAAVNSSGAPVRNKVVVFFTDGEPSNSKHADASAQNATFFGTVTPTLRFGKTVKEVGVGNINGRIYCIDLAMSSSTKDFLKHLSSNYPKGDAKVLTGGYNAANLTGVLVPIDHDQHVGTGDQYEFTEDEYKFLKNEQAIYYKDSNDGDLRSVFASIAAANTGAMGGTMLAVDTMSESFVLPEGVDDSGKVKVYTAECIGTKEIDGKEYLAFAEPIQIKDRDALDHLWCVREVPQTDGSTKAEWVDIAGEFGIDIDSKIAFETTSDGKKITVSGFQYSDLWCGVDPDATHNNTRQMASTDPNAGFAKPGYRGFKLIFEFPIIIDPDALGGVNVPTNDWANSGLYKVGESEPEVNYPTPDLPVPVKLVIQKTGLQPGESANFTVQRKLRTDTGDTYVDFTTFVLTGDASKTPEVRIINLDPAYYYKVKEGSWSWAYENVSKEYYTTDPNDNPIAKNPIVFENDPEDAPKHAEAKATNVLKDW